MTGEICEQCGKEHNRVWWCLDVELFEQYRNGQTILCMDCFDGNVGELLLYWECALGEYPTESLKAEVAELRKALRKYDPNHPLLEE